MADGDFPDFAAARWQPLVRAAVLLGCSLPDAEDVAQTTLVRCLVHWRRVSRADDRDALRVPSPRPRARRQSAASLVGRGADRAATGHCRLGPDDRRRECQIAEALDIAPGTVKSRLSRGLAALATDVDLAATTRGDER